MLLTHKVKQILNGLIIQQISQVPITKCSLFQNQVELSVNIKDYRHLTFVGPTMHSPVPDPSCTTPRQPTIYNSP